MVREAQLRQDKKDQSTIKKITKIFVGKMRTTKRDKTTFMPSKNS